MSNSAGHITAPVSLIDDVFYVLGIAPPAGQDYDLGYACANAHGQINAWAKHKPVRHSSVETTDETYKGANGNCGFDLTNSEYSTIYALRDALDAGGGGWAYLAPQIGVDWCRLLDFEGYQHNAGCPFPRVMSGTYSKAINGSIRISLMYDALLASGNLSITDIKHRGNDLSSYYLGMLVWNSSNTYYAVSDAAGLGDIRDFYFSNIAAGEYKATMFLMSVPLLDNAMPAGAYVLAAGRREITTLTVSPYVPDYQASVTGTITSIAFNGMDYEYYAVLRNNTNAAYTFTNAKIQIAELATVSGAPVYTLVGNILLLDVEVAANSEVIKTGFGSTLSGSTSTTYYIRVTWDGGYSEYTAMRQLATE